MYLTASETKWETDPEVFYDNPRGSKRQKQNNFQNPMDYERVNRPDGNFVGTFSVDMRGWYRDTDYAHKRIFAYM